jgi:beta-galactosidase
VTPEPAGVWFGGDYNPEQWDEKVWAADDALMREARVNTATVGVFSWSVLEPEEGRFDFGWLDGTLDRLWHNGIRVVLATPTASPPPWFTLAHPDAMPVTRDGTRLWHGSRDTYCVAAPAYRAAAARMAGALAERYAGHPALAMWHVHNEYGTVCWCDHAAAAFRRWLQRRYGEGRYGPGRDGLAALNEAWGTAFWSQRYSSWEQVLPPRATQWLANPSQMLDYHRFWSDELLAAFCEQRDAIRRHTPDIPVTTNFILPGYQVPDFWAWSREVDVVSIDHYLGSAGFDGHADIAFGADRARSFNGGRPWILMEQSTSLIYQRDRILTKEPGRMLRDSVGYLARGSDSVMFFQWRASRAGAELFHPAMVPHAGPDTRIFREVCELGRVVARLGEVAGSTVSADVALLWDADSWWALENRGIPLAEVGYLDLVRADHAALWRAGVVCDFVHPEGDLARYRLVLATAAYLISDEGAQALREYVGAGGHVVMSFGGGMVDSSHHARLGGGPGALRDVFGIRVEEFRPLARGQTVALAGQAATLADEAVGLAGEAAGLAGEAVRLAGEAAGLADAGHGPVWSGTVWSEDLRSEGAEVLASYAEGPLSGHPAITRNSFGAGTAWYVSTQLDEGARDRLFAAVAAQAGAGPVVAGAPPGVEIVRRHGDGGRSWLFVLNHTPDPAVIDASGVELVSGQPVPGRLEVAPGAVAVVREHGSGAGTSRADPARPNGAI